MASTVDPRLGQYIALRRNQLHLRQEDLAERLGNQGEYRAASTIANWEAGRTPVPLELLRILASALEETSPGKLYDLAGLLDDLPGDNIVRLLDGMPADEIRRIERMISAYLENTD